MFIFKELNEIFPQTVRLESLPLQTSNLNECTFFEEKYVKDPKLAINNLNFFECYLSQPQRLKDFMFEAV